MPDIVKSVMRLAPVMITLQSLNSGKPAFRDWSVRLKQGGSRAANILPEQKRCASLWRFRHILPERRRFITFSGRWRGHFSPHSSDYASSKK